MGVEIFRSNHWERIKSGAISRRDILGLDPAGDSELIGYLIAHAPEACRRSMMNYAAGKLGMDELPEPRVNADDPGDRSFWAYAVLREQVMRETDRAVLTDAALHGLDRDMAAFAFCRLTGYRMTPGTCDADSYRTFDCGLLPGTTAGQIAALCQRIIEKKWPLEAAAKDCRSRLFAKLDQCTDDGVLYDIACIPGKDPDLVPVREKAAMRIRGRDYQYALSSHILIPARTAMILNLYDSLDGDARFIARTILTDPNDQNKAHMLLYCKDEALLMLGWRYVYGARRLCTDRLHAMGSRFPEAYGETDPQERAEWERNWFSHAADMADELLSEDDAVRERLSGAASVDSEPLRFFLSIHHPRKAVRWWHARKLENPVRIACVGSWTADDQIKEALSFKINSTDLITEMLFGDLSGADMVFGFRKPEDLTLQDRFCVEIMKNHPDQRIREHVRKELLRGKIEIPGVDLTIPDSLYRGQ